MIHFIYANLIIDNDNFITLLEITVEWKLIIQLNRALLFCYYHINEQKITNNTIATLGYYQLNEFYKSKSNLPGEAIELMKFPKKYY